MGQRFDHEIIMYRVLGYEKDVEESDPTDRKDPKKKDGNKSVDHHDSARCHEIYIDLSSWTMTFKYRYAVPFMKLC